MSCIRASQPAFRLYIRTPTWTAAICGSPNSGATVAGASGSKRPSASTTTTTTWSLRPHVAASPEDHRCGMAFSAAPCPASPASAPAAAGRAGHAGVAADDDSGASSDPSSTTRIAVL
jgi:hypothetical protein